MTDFNTQAIDSLNAAQKEAVVSPARYVLVAAGPGSGKTRVLAFRYARLMEGGAAPEKLLAITFTNRAADEMKARLGAVAGSLRPQHRPDFPNIGTFHKFCLNLLRKKREFTLIGRPAQETLLKGMGVKNADKAIEEISAFKNSVSRAAGERDKGLLRPESFDLYEAALRERNSLDLDDLIIEAAGFIEMEPDSAPVFSHILVDEFQDINQPQARLVKLLTASGASLFAIGDPDQSIYAFRGASVERFLEFGNDYPGAHLITLDTNYRSTRSIVHASGELIKKNTMRILRPGVTALSAADTASDPCGDEAVKVVIAADENGEAEFVLREIERLMGGLTSLSASSLARAVERPYRFSDFVVLVRTNRQADAFKEAFRRSPIPFEVAGNIGPLSIFAEHLRGLNVDGMDKAAPVDLIKKEAGAFGLSDGFIQPLIGMAESLDRQGRLLDDRQGNAWLKSFLNALADSLILMQPADSLDIEADRVVLMTLHMAKGLEFPVVFIAGCEDGLVPLRFKGASTDMEEERRLLYVGMTRARERLYLLNAGRRRIWNEVRRQSPSPFLKELGDGSLENIAFAWVMPARRPVQKGLFD
ncbi:MAG: UvrD-helicase domain-containing protein [Deltaproteobacteria bacterium]|nr:UvrD-helicase domain-containing protein [Deltaproteobacteria bacterium]